MARVKFFANFREVAGTKEIHIDAADVEELLEKLSSMFKDMRNLIYDEKGNVKDYVQIMVNGNHIGNLNGVRTKLGEADVVAIFPPVSGG